MVVFAQVMEDQVEMDTGVFIRTIAAGSKGLVTMYRLSFYLFSHLCKFPNSTTATMLGLSLHFQFRVHPGF